MPMRKPAAASLAFAAFAGSLALTTPARATPEFQKRAREAGIVTVKSCQSCHVVKLPKKDAHELNDMGQWLLKEKDNRKAKDIDVVWLKDYTPPQK